VRRFNFFTYTNNMPESLKMAQNPNVSVRICGVMEKYTYCVQRIESAKIAARSAVGQGAPNAVDGSGKAAVRVAEGAVISACAQVCPTTAIQFGDVSDPNSEFFKKWSAGQGGNPRSYEVLEHLNVRPRTHYMAKIRNLNAEFEPEQPSGTEVRK
jgi:molybdopterin-containing oxidoreductase family iron-sulfur binding subunit